MRLLLAIGMVCVGLGCFAGAVRAEPVGSETGPSAEQVRFFETSIRPLLIEKCHKCHGVEKQWGTLRLDSREALLKGGDSGAAVVPGKPAESLLVKAISHTDDDLRMPPKEKLSDRQIADLTRWVSMGAPFPTAVASSTPRLRDPNHWAFRPPVEPVVPETPQATRSNGVLDRFILAKLDAVQLESASPASKRTLIRRATFDLTGLPPTPEAIAEFLSDDRPDAFARLVDRLLASPTYGERWGRHWLDVARYADSNGLDENVCHGNAWRYRDYVVAAFNQDQPFDEFLIEQLAGDLLPAADDATRHRLLIATGFLSIGPKVLAETDESKMRMDIIDEQIDTVGRAIFGLTLACARCHDHKFDPIETADYYGLAGVFKSTRTMDKYTKLAVWHENPTPTPVALALKAAHDEQVTQKKAALQAFIDKGDAAVKLTLPAGEAPPAKLEDKYPDETKAELKKLREELAKFEKAAPVMPSAMGVNEDAVIDVAIHIRGNPLKLGEVVPRRVPLVLAGASAPKFVPEQSGRLELARWLVGADHPLTSRVLANRVWRWHFGRGLVRSTDNFGLLGERPSHPELLDWLARRVTQRGWSLKTLHRQIMDSQTYQADSRAEAMLIERDPENRLFGRADVRRLEAEAVRDSLIAVGDTLDQTLGGSLLKIKNRDYFFDHTSTDLTDYKSQRRSLYLPVVRNNVYDVFQLLDYPDAAIPTGDRTTTTIAPQALLMMNSDLVAKCSADLATKVWSESRSQSAADGGDSHRIALAYANAFGREPSASEVAGSLEFINQVEQTLATQEGTPEQRRRQAWNSLCHVLLSSNEFIYLR